MSIISIAIILLKLRNTSDEMGVTDRQKLLRLIVKDIFIDDETIRIRHSIPVTLTGTNLNTKIPSYLSFKGVKFLGVIIHTGFTRIQEKKVEEFKDKVRRITCRNSPVNLETVIRDLNPVCRGFANYFRIANCKQVFERLFPWIRRRLRAKQLKLWKKPARLHRRLRQLGYKGEFKSIKMNSWRNSASPLASYSLPNKYFETLGLFYMRTVQTGISVIVT